MGCGTCDRLSVIVRMGKLFLGAAHHDEAFGRSGNFSIVRFTLGGWDCVLFRLGESECAREWCADGDGGQSVIISVYSRSKSLATHVLLLVCLCDCARRGQPA